MGTVLHNLKSDSDVIPDNISQTHSTQNRGQALKPFGLFSSSSYNETCRKGFAVKAK